MVCTVAVGAESNQASFSQVSPIFCPFVFPPARQIWPGDGVCRLLFVEGVTSQECFLHAPFPRSLRVLVWVWSGLLEGGVRRGMRHLVVSVCPDTVIQKQVRLERASTSLLGVVCAACGNWASQLNVWLMKKACCTPKLSPLNRINSFEHVLQVLEEHFACALPVSPVEKHTLFSLLELVKIPK